MEFATLKTLPVSAIHFTCHFAAHLVTHALYSEDKIEMIQRRFPLCKVGQFESDNLSKESDEHICSLFYLIPSVINPDKGKLRIVMKDINLIVFLGGLVQFSLDIEYFYSRYV